VRGCRDILFYVYTPNRSSQADHFPPLLSIFPSMRLSAWDQMKCPPPSPLPALLSKESASVLSALSQNERRRTAGGGRPSPPLPTLTRERKKERKVRTHRVSFSLSLCLPRNLVAFMPLHPCPNTKEKNASRYSKRKEQVFRGVSLFVLRHDSKRKKQEGRTEQTNESSCM